MYKKYKEYEINGNEKYSNPCGMFVRCYVAIVMRLRLDVSGVEIDCACV